MHQVNRDGVRLCFEEAGSGRPPLLFVHGWTCDHTFLAPQFQHFQLGHRVVSVDLRGHGQSDKPRQDYTMRCFAEDLEWLCRQLAIEKPVVVGHSMGGVIALVLAASFPALPAAIVTLESPILPPQATTDILAPFMEALRGPAYQEMQRHFVADQMFLPTDDPVRKQQIVDGMSSAPQHVTASAFENIFGFDHAGAVVACKVPWLAVHAEQIISDLARLRELCPGVITGQTVGAGHFHQLEVPGQVNAMIERFLVVSLAD